MAAENAYCCYGDDVAVISVAAIHVDNGVELVLIILFL